jgi:hypothetical protein
MAEAMAEAAAKASHPKGEAGRGRHTDGYPDEGGASGSGRSCYDSAGWHGDAARVGVVGLALVLGFVGRGSLDHIIALVGALSSAPLALVAPPWMHGRLLDRLAEEKFDQALNDASAAARLEEATGISAAKAGRLWAESVRAEALEGQRRARLANAVLAAVGVVITVATTVLVLATWGDAAS